MCGVGGWWMGMIWKCCFIGLDLLGMEWLLLFYGVVRFYVCIFIILIYKFCLIIRVGIDSWLFLFILYVLDYKNRVIVFGRW